MNRRDLVITAVLMNAMLLVALFITSKRSAVKNYVENYQEFSSSQIVKVQVPEEKVVEKPSVPMTSVVAQQPIVKETLAAQFLEEKPVVTPMPAPVASQQVQEASVPDERQQPQNPQENSKETYTNVIVKKGDFLERIARANQTTVAVLMKVNNLTSTQLKIGQVIKVPIVKQTENSNSSIVEVDRSENYYTVQEGDSPWTIALRSHIRLEELLRLNDLDEQKARRLRPGDQLRIR